MKKTIEIEIDERLLADVERVAATLKLSMGDAISGMCVGWFARLDAGKALGHDRQLFEFSRADLADGYEALRAYFEDELQAFVLPPEARTAIEGRAIAMNLTVGQYLLQLVAAGLADDRGFWAALLPADPDVVDCEAREAKRILAKAGLTGKPVPPAHGIIEFYRRSKAKKRALCGANALSPGEIDHLALAELRGIVASWCQFFDGGPWSFPALNVKDEAAGGDLR